MARAAGKKQAPAKVEEDDDNEGWDDAVVEADTKEGAGDLRLRDWRDVERFREMKELRSLVDDDYGLEEIFRAPVKLRSDQGRVARLAPPPAKAAPAKAPAVAPKAAPKGSAKAAAKPARPAAKVKAKAKRK